MLKHLSPEAVRSLTAAASRVTLQSGQILFREGDPTGGVFIVEDGHIALTRNGTPIAELGPGQMFGEMASLDGGPRVVTVTASEPTTLVAIPPEAYNAAVYGNLAVLTEVLRVVLSRVRGLEDALRRG
jgi:CRP-like cAMP-binding protein